MLSLMWAQGRYDLRLTDAEFWAMTPRQFHLLYDRHREHLAHVEMVAAFTTSAVINNSPFARDEAVPWTRFAPNHPHFEGRDRTEEELSDEEEDAREDWLAKARQLAAEMKQGGGALLESVQRGESV